MYKLSSTATALLIALSFCGSTAYALDPSKTLTQYAHRIWGQEEGLFQPTIYSIAQSRDGFLWLGTQDSLIRFDGLHFRELQNGNRKVFDRSLIRALISDREGNLWAGSIGGGLVEIGANGALTRYTTKQGLPSDSVFCLAPDSKNRMWVCTNQGLARLDHGRVRVFTTADGLPTNQIRSMCEAADGTRWVAGLDFGLARSTLGRSGDSRFEPYSDSQIAARENVAALACASDGSVWVGKTSGLTQIRDARSRTFTMPDGLPDDAVSSLAEGPDGSVWIGTNDGISRYQHGEISVYRTRDGLSHSVVLSLYLDREGSLWAGTKDGLDQFTDGKVTPYTTNEGMLSNDAGPVLEDTGGRLWVGTLGHGLSWFDGHRFHAVTTKDGLLDDTVLSLETGKQGDLWVGTKTGLNRVRDGKVVATYPKRDAFSAAATHALQGEYLHDSKFNALKGALHPVDAYYTDDAHHSEWLGTLGSGLLRWQNGVLAHVRVKDGLYDNRIYSILKDDRANFWMASSKGIFRVSEKELEDFADGKSRSITSIPFSTGQLRFECQSGVQPAACRTRDGRLWFSTNNGLVVLDPNHLRENQTPPPVAITAVIANGERLNARQGLRFKPFQKNLEIRYAGLTFLSPEKVTFRYVLNGYEKGWTEAGARREAFFTNLPPGDFHFEVMARNADGVWSAQPATLDFTIQPMFYQRPWFVPFVALVLAMLIAAGYRVRIRQIERRFDLVLAERSRIARELHDTLLQGLSGITMQLQALWKRLPGSAEKRVLGDIIKDAGRCSTEARQSLWGLRAVDTERPIFSEKLGKLARQATEGGPVSLSLTLAPVALNVSPEVEYQLLRIAQEAIANALRHAQGTNVKVALDVDARQLHMAIEDDGVGFATAMDAEFGHFGLLGMRERADEIHAELTVTSSPGQGTKVSVRLPVSQIPTQDGNTTSNADGAFAHQIR